MAEPDAAEMQSGGSRARDGDAPARIGAVGGGAGDWVGVGALKGSAGVEVGAVGVLDAGAAGGVGA